MSTLQLSFESLADDDAERVAELGRALREAVLSTDVEKADFAENARAAYQAARAINSEAGIVQHAARLLSQLEGVRKFWA